eukprot:scaffold195432_cov18-Tisochrysis_lutea.AAC.1
MASGSRSRLAARLVRGMSPAGASSVRPGAILPLFWVCPSSFPCGMEEAGRSACRPPAGSRASAPCALAASSADLSAPARRLAPACTSGVGLACWPSQLG